MSDFDAPRLAELVRRGWHVLRDSGEWGLVDRVIEDHRDVVLVFADRIDTPMQRVPKNNYLLTRTPVEQMHAAIRERDYRAGEIKREFRERRTGLAARPLQLAG